MYFCCLEALQNAAKYAGAARIDVRMRERGGEIEFEIADDGAGFDVDATPKGAGLVNMNDRLSVFGGRPRSRRRPGAGRSCADTSPSRRSRWLGDRAPQRVARRRDRPGAYGVGTGARVPARRDTAWAQVRPGRRSALHSRSRIRSSASIVASRRPENAIGWLLLVASGLWAITVLAAGYATFAVSHGTTDSQLSIRADWLQAWLYAPPCSSRSCRCSCCSPTVGR